MVVCAIRGILSQRLVRTLCHQCKKPYTPPAEALKRMGLESEDGRQFFKPEGCGACMQQGYWGRTGVFEILTVDAAINKAILAKKTAREIFDLARKKQDFRTLRQFGMDMVAQGITSIEEVLRVLPTL